MEHKWYEVQEAVYSHAYDSFYVTVNKRHVVGALLERGFESFLNVIGEPCCKKGIWRYLLPGEWGDGVSYEILNTPLQALWRWFPVTQQMHYPLADQWVILEAPDTWEWGSWSLDDEKDPDHGEYCPVCGWGRVNTPNTDWIALYGMCFQCFLRSDATYDGRP